MVAIEYEAASLALTRLTSVVISVLALIVVFTVWSRQPTDSSQRIIPRPVLVFTGGWLIVLTAFASSLLITGREAVSDGLERAVYGMSFIWSIGGLAWMAWCGQRAIWAGRRISEAVKEVGDGP